MMIRIAVLGAVLALAACGGSGTVEESVPVDKVFVEDERSPEKSAGFCAKCKFTVYEGHRCGLTVPCVLCKREQGARHVHEVVWTCPVDGVQNRQQHICNDARICDLCRKDKRSLLGTRGCPRCYRQAPATALHGLTTYCGTCNLEVGPNHVHGKTSYCRTCLREAGEGHKCSATWYCASCQVEQAPDHIHGTTRFCSTCSRDCGVDHKHGLTEWCWKCEAEVEWPHQFH
jgi:hypothetical protein